MRSCYKFHGYLSQIENRQRSGTTEVDKVLQEKLLYIDIEKKKFAFDHCWEVLKQGIKWHDLAMQTKQNHAIIEISDMPHPTSPSQVPETPNSQDSNHFPFENNINDLNKRPIGRKVEKESQK
ncbi:hypothetical protein Ddye_029767 [Dipteronia dyeriana]|uniref:No apical meristem-associated C-terminal domain-containing protein n=1 Tax=Dipteronia dyeriana TaxID=168575 RepID=A0AAD9TGB5_9ROSI|nr:hypothetical protein Ddye_029767 [Dipteronia dyeriana]